uniref:SFRICE_004201 n=1 Tax=Spodoptera frugiperda TaxID=7108 RepID=A0A2H1V0I8_SPOFR
MSPNLSPFDKPNQVTNEKIRKQTKFIEVAQWISKLKLQCKVRRTDSHWDREFLKMANFSGLSADGVDPIINI